MAAVADIFASISDQPELFKVKLEEFEIMTLNGINTVREQVGLPQTTKDILRGNTKKETLYTKVKESDSRNKFKY